MKLFTRRAVPVPTLAGWLCLAAIAVVPLLLWWSVGERFLAVTDRAQPDILVVEGWIGIDGVHAAAAEFVLNHYRMVVTTGGSTNARWSERQWNYAEMAARELARAGVPEERIVVAPSRNTEAHRTYEMAVSVRDALQSRGVPGGGVTVFTRGVHTRRSRMTFAKTLPAWTVGVVSWMPPSEDAQPWWHSSERALDFVKETVGCPFEFFLSSGRSASL